MVHSSSMYLLKEYLKNTFYDFHEEPALQVRTLATTEGVTREVREGGAAMDKEDPRSL